MISLRSNDIRLCSLLLSCVLLLGWTIAVSADSNPDHAAKKSTAELESLRDRIREIKASIDETQGESTTLRKQLEASEAEVEAAIQESRRLDEQIRKKQEALESLEEEQEQHDQAFQQHRKLLLQHVLTSYQQQQHPHSQTLRFSGDVQDFARQRVYQQHVQLARTNKLQQVEEQLAALRAVKQAMRLEASQLALLQDQQETHLKGLQKHRDQRVQLMAQLEHELSDQTASLRAMQADETRLKKLINQLKAAAKKLAQQRQQDQAQFAHLKGKLHWPAAGAIMHPFGSPRVGSKLSWQGVLIKAPLGSEVKAISAGNVIFSDWFQNLGQLIIVDHGQDYLSLYGHNQELFRRVGDKVKKGDVIASVGDTGGRRNSGLYFEIRRKSKPVNPAIWCKKP